MAFVRAQAAPQSTVRVGMTDPHLNETVTFVAEVDQDVPKVQCQNISVCSIITQVVLSIILPCCGLFILLIYCISYRQRKSKAQGTRVYLTDRTLVYVRTDLPQQHSRVTVPLNSIASVVVYADPPTATVNVKPTEIPVINYHMHLKDPTHSVSIGYLKDPEAFASAVRERTQ